MSAGRRKRRCLARLVFRDARRLSLSFTFRFSGFGGSWARTRRHLLPIRAGLQTGHLTCGVAGFSETRGRFVIGIGGAFKVEYAADESRR